MFRRLEYSQLVSCFRDSSALLLLLISTSLVLLCLGVLQFGEAEEKHVQ